MLDVMLDFMLDFMLAIILYMSCIDISIKYSAPLSRLGNA